MKDYFVWKAEYALGFKEIDEQHQYFVSLLNKLYTAIMEMKPQEDLAVVLNDLVAYTDKHFQTEEKYFTEFGFEGAEDHKAKHRELKASVVEFKDKMLRHEAVIDFELVDFLENWLLDHLSKVDKKYVACFQEHGLK